MKTEELMPIFIEAAQHVLKTMANTSTSVGASSPKSGTQCWGVVTGIISMAAPTVSGTLVLSFDDKSIVEIVKNMFLEEFPVDSPEVTDAVGEITNMVCGVAKQHLGNQGLAFNMATPMIVRGMGTSISQLHAKESLQAQFSTATGAFVLESNVQAH